MAVGDWYRWPWFGLGDNWKRWPTERWGEPGTRQGQRCRLLAVGAKDTALVQFEDGRLYRTDRKGLRKER